MCLLIVLAGCAGSGAGGDATDSTPAPTATETEDAGSGGSGGADSGAGSGGDSNEASGSAGGDDTPPDMAVVLRTGESYEYAVHSAVLADEPETGTITIDVTEGGEWPGVAMDVVRDAPGGRMEASSQAAVFSPAMGEMSYALNVRNLVVTSRLVTGRSTDIRTYEVGETWRFRGSDTEANFEVVDEEDVGGLAAKHVRVTGGAESDLDAEVWLVHGVGFPVKFVQMEDGEATIELTLTSYSG
ncbi:hypothetical protein C474_09629 [Halogeometricum pallidum JCM 14848]|uniref:DUF3108 domain-containing protein n=1 Tax=Halogeometricum pallidum JCM 14848 TaxID=1227487 RepID=M0D6J8_HALPD|nr:hypothetical protein C474_09629 [Halogeometricum pallidum JCM 14848]